MSLTVEEIKAKLCGLLAEKLPPILQQNSLDNFDEYLDSQPSDMEKMQIGMYLSEETDDESQHSIMIIVQAQIYKKGDWQQRYHSAIMGVLRKYVDAFDYGFISRSIAADLWPVYENATSFYYYTITFTRELYDCDD